MKLLPKFRIGSVEFEPAEEQPGVLIIVILTLVFLFLAPKVGCSSGTDDASHQPTTEAHAESH